jgi:hypothetical protein
MNHQRLLLAFALGLGLTLGVVILLGGPLPARAGPAAAVRYVTTTGHDFVSFLSNDCTNPKAPCGAGVSVDNSEARMLHTTIARNRGGVGGVCALGGSSVALTNTILVSHATGIQVYGSNTATLEGTLWGSGGWANAEDWAGTGAISTGTVDVRGDPAFVDPGGWDYHIGPGSAAINAGVEAGVETDVDGDPRPPGRPPDIGADECELRVYLPAVLRD